MQAVLWIALLAAAAGAQMFGTWKMNPALSTGDGPGPWGRSYTLRIEPHPEGDRITIWRVTAEGRSETEMYVLRPDGKDRPYLMPDRFDTIVARKLPDGALEEVVKKNGQVVLRGRRRLSVDGKQLIQEYQWTSPPDRKATLVLERIDGATQ
jgi:hypothetical protein